MKDYNILKFKTCFGATAFKDEFDYTLGNGSTRLVLTIVKTSFTKGKATASSYLKPLFSKLQSESFDMFYKISSKITG